MPNPKESRLKYYILKDMNIPVKLPILVRSDFIGTMFMAEKASSRVRTSDINTWYHFIRENVEDGVIMIVYLRSGSNNSMC
jgi:hypothetical protein